MSTATEHPEVSRYFLRTDSGHQEINIDRIRFASIKQAHAGLVDAMIIEDNFEKVRSNYIELERCLFTISLDHSFNRRKSEVQGDEWRSELDRLISNILSSARTYFDHTESTLINNTTAQPLQSHFSATRSQHYDASASFQICESLRNISQHSASIVHGVNLETRRVMIDGDDYHEFSVYPFFSQRMLDKKKIKAAVRSRLDELDDRVDLRPHLRLYISSIESIHHSLRNSLTPFVTAWDELFDEVLQSMGEAGVDGFVEAVAQDKEGTWIDRVPVFVRMRQYREALKQRNSLEYGTIGRVVTNRFVANSKD